MRYHFSELSGRNALSMHSLTLSVLMIRYSWKSFMEGMVSVFTEEAVTPLGVETVTRS